MKSKQRKYLINRWYLAAFVLILALLIVGSSYLYYQSELKSIRIGKYEELKAIADLKTNQILQWRIDRMQDANSARSVFFGKAIKDYALDTSDKKLQQNLLLRLEQYEQQYHYAAAFLLNEEKKLLITSDSISVHIDETTLRNCTIAANQKSTICTDIFYNQHLQEALIEIVTPIFNNASIVAFMVLQTNPENFLFPLIQSWPTPSKTAETVLVKRDGDMMLIVNDVRHVRNTALKLRIPLSKTKVAGVQAILGKTGVTESEDYRGVKVIADLRSIPGTNWFMVTKVDKEELFKELNTMATMMIIFLVIILLILAFGLSLLFRFRQQTIYSELHNTERVLRNTEQELQVTLRNIGDAVITCSIDNRIQSMNPMAESLTGWSETDAAGKDINEILTLILGESRSTVKDVINELLKRIKSGNPAERLLLLSKKNEEIPVSFSIASLAELDKVRQGYMIAFRDETAEYEAELKLKYSEETFSKLFEFGPFPSALVRLSDLIVMNVNQSFLETTGLEPHEIINLDYTEFGPWKNVEELKKFIERLKLENKIENYEFDFITKAGQNRKALINAMIMDLHNEKYILGRMVDITDSFLIQNALKESEAQYRSLFESMLNGYAYCRVVYENNTPIDFEFIKVNKALETLSGIKNVEGHRITEFLPNLRESDPELFEIYKRFVASGEPVQFEYYLNSLEQWFVVTVYSHSKDYFVVIFDVITERKKAEQALMESELRFRSTLDNMMEGCQIIDYEWKYFYINTTAATFGNLKKEDMLGKKITDFFPDFESTDMYTALNECMTKRISMHQEFFFRFPDGRDCWFDFSIQPVPEGIFILSLDVTERKKAQEELSSLNKVLDNRVRERTEQLEFANNELEAFSYSVSHDLRAPLRHISGYSQIMLNDFGNNLPEKATSYLTTIVQAVKTMSTLIDDLLHFSRTGRAELIKSSFSMNELLNDARTPIMLAAENRKIDWVIDPLPDIKGDYNLLKQVWSNLLSNAVKYSRDRSPAVIRIGFIKEEKEYVFHIADNGVGFDMKYADKLFGVFQRLHSVDQFEGTGIGLANVRRIVSRHGGRTWADARLDEGATFYFSLPIQS